MMHDRSAEISIREPSIRRAAHHMHMHDEDGALTARCVRCAVCGVRCAVAAAPPFIRGFRAGLPATRPATGTDGETWSTSVGFLGNRGEVGAGASLLASDSEKTKPWRDRCRWFALLHLINAKRTGSCIAHDEVSREVQEVLYCAGGRRGIAEARRAPGRSRAR